MVSLQKPFNISIRGQTVDAKETNTITWQISGDITTSIAINILKNSDNTLIWSLPKTSSYAQKYVLSPNSLVNGNEYKIQIVTWNERNETISSDYEVFQTSSRPLASLPSITIISSPTYEFTATYTQAENVPLRSWIAYLYNENQTIVSQSGLQTSEPIKQLFQNLQSEKTYFVEFQVTSSKGLTGSTGKIPFQVLFSQPSISINLEAENVPEVAGIKLSWDVIQIIFKADHTPPIFINNEKIDLRNNRIYANEGVKIDRDFTMKIWLESPKLDVDLVKLKGSNGEIYLQRWSDNKFHLFKSMYGIKSHWASSTLVGTSFFICIQSIGDYYNIFAEVIN